MQKLILLSLVCLVSFESYAQIGGRYAFEALAGPASARLTALGGSLINIADGDVALAQSNPAVLDSLSDNQIDLSYNFHYAGIRDGNFGIGRRLHKLGIDAHAAIRFINYGDFLRTDEFGNQLGEFDASETALILGGAKRLNERIRLGINVKTLLASYDAYNALGYGADIGLLYQKPGSLKNWALVIKNIGGEVTDFTDDINALPLDVQLGYSHRLEHMPLRFSFIAHHLQKWNVRERIDAPQNSNDIFNSQSETTGFGRAVDNLFQHLIISGEFLFGKLDGFKLRVAYNHLRKQDLKLSEFRSLAGFSMGFGFRIKSISFDYGIGYYHLDGTTNHLTIRLDGDRFLPRSKHTKLR